MDGEESFVMIEEPENHIHPDMQRRLLKFINSVEDKQFFIATHSNVFLDPSYVDKTYYVKNEAATIQLYDNTTKASILRDIGYSVVDNLVSDVIILTEGPSDKIVIEEVCRKMQFWSSYEIKCWPMAGDIMSQLDLSVFEEHIGNNKIIALIDHDNISKPFREDFKKMCKEYKIDCTQLERYAIENYIPLKVLKICKKFHVPDTITEIKPNEKLKEQIGFNIKKSLRWLIRKTLLEDIEGTDLYKFCEKIRSIAEK